MTFLRAVVSSVLILANSVVKVKSPVVREAVTVVEFFTVSQSCTVAVAKLAMAPTVL